MLIDEQNSNVFAIPCIPVKSLFDEGGLGFGIDDEEVLLGVGGLGHMLYIFQSDCVFKREIEKETTNGDIHQYLQVAIQSQNPRSLISFLVGAE